MKAICSLGFGPSDIMLDLAGTTCLLMEKPCMLDKFRNGIVSKGQIDLTIEEAEQLSRELQGAILYFRNAMEALPRETER